ETRVANTKSALKKIRVSERRRRRNQPIRTAVKTYLRKAQEAVAGAPAEPATVEAVVAAISQLDRAAGKGVIHANNAARRKSRLMKAFNAALKPKVEDTAEAVPAKKTAAKRSSTRKASSTTAKTSTRTRKAKEES